MKKKQKKLEDLQKDLQNADVVAEADGVVQSISTGNSSDGNDTFMTILQTGAYKIKGKVSELEVRDLEKGAEVTIHSRIDESKTWAGTISQVDTEGAVSESDDSPGEMTRMQTIPRPSIRFMWCRIHRMI